MNQNNLYYIIKIRIQDSKWAFEQQLDTNNKAEAIAKTKEYKQNKEVLSITLMERLEGYEDRIIYEFERE